MGVHQMFYPWDFSYKAVTKVPWGNVVVPLGFEHIFITLETKCIFLRFLFCAGKTANSRFKTMAVARKVIKDVECRSFYTLKIKQFIQIKGVIFICIFIQKSKR